MGQTSHKRGGGRTAADGFRHQYLRTLEALLSSLASEEDHDWVYLIDEPGEAESIDYRVTSGSNTLLACQVKSSYDPTTAQALQRVEAIKIVTALCADVEAEHYLLQTNRRLHPDVERLANILKDGSWSDLRESDRAAAEKAWPLSSTELRRRLMRVCIETDLRTSDELQRDLVNALVKVRRSRGDGVGVNSSSVLLNHCLAEVFHRGAGLSWTLSRADLESMINLDDATLALATGEVDWGRTLAEVIPLMPSIPRQEDEELVRRALAGGQCRRSVRSVVVSGLSGIGKTSLAARYARIHMSAYDVVIWLNAESTSSLATGARRALPVGRISIDTDDDQVRRELIRWLGETPLTLLLVLDSAPGTREVKSWLPRTG